MIGRTNTGGGGAGGYAFIVADWPVGSTCQAVRSGDGKTLKAKGTTGHFVFRLPKPITAGVAETWTVSCTNGSETASRAVTISSEGQSETVMLAYNFYLVQNGILVVTNWTLARGSSTAAGVFQRSGYVQFSTETSSGGGVNMVAATTDPVDISDYQTLRLTIADTGKSYYTSAKVPLFGVGDTRPTGTGSSSDVSGFDYYKMLAASTGNIQAGTYDIDVSALSGNYYIAVSLSDSTYEFPKAFIDVTEFVLLK